MLERHAAEGIHRVEHALVNFYLVEDGDALLVVDAGHPRSWGPLQDAVEALGRRLSDVAAVVLTHGHFDHVGFARRRPTKHCRPARSSRSSTHAPAKEAHPITPPW